MSIDSSIAIGGGYFWDLSFNFDVLISEWTKLKIITVFTYSDAIFTTKRGKSLFNSG